MCRAHVLRFSCSHGILMCFEPCRLGPCPVIKTTSEKLPQQPYRCYNCQQRKESKTSRPVTRDRSTTTSCAPNATLFDTEGLDSAPIAALSSFRRAQSFPTTPISSPQRPIFPQKLTHTNTHISTLAIARRPNSSQPFRFTCHSSTTHLQAPHYLGLPSHLPHQDRPCPPCQLQELRSKGEADAYRQAAKEHPHLTTEMLIRDGCIKEWQEKPTLAEYVEEKVVEEREMWVHVTRKWTQDLKRVRILVGDEDGLGLHA